MTLADALPPGTIHLGRQIVSVKLDPSNSYPILQLLDGSSIVAKVVINVAPLLLLLYGGSVQQLHIFSAKCNSRQNMHGNLLLKFNRKLKTFQKHSFS